MIGIDPKKLVYNGQYENEGHMVSFQLCIDETVLIQEMFIGGAKVANNERKVLLSEAIEFQDHLIKFGYDKVS